MKKEYNYGLTSDEANRLGALFISMHASIYTAAACDSEGDACGGTAEDTMFWKYVVKLDAYSKLIEIAKMIMTYNSTTWGTCVNGRNVDLTGHYSKADSGLKKLKKGKLVGRIIYWESFTEAGKRNEHSDDNQYMTVLIPAID